MNVSRLQPRRLMAAALVALPARAFAEETNAGPRSNDPQCPERAARLAVLFLRTELLGDKSAAALPRHGGGLPPGDQLESSGTLLP